MDIKDKSFEKIKKEAEDWYDSIDEAECPYFNDVVAFNAKGLKHVKFKKDRVARTRSDQFIRLKNLKFSQRILEKSKTLQEYKEERCFEEKKSGNRRENVLQDVKYYGFVSIIKDDHGMRRLKIIVKQVAGGKLYFWSIIPFWKSNRDIKRMYSGNLEED